jgi:ELWxxDGT repeat protein
MKNKVWIPLLFFLWGSSPGFSQYYQMVKDISPGQQSSFAWADPYAIRMIFGQLGDKVLMASFNDATDMSQFWVSDGTQEGTELVYEYGPYFNEVFWRNLTIEEENLSFVSLDLPDKTEIWQYDGNDFIKLTETEYPLEEMVYWQDQLYFIVKTAPFDFCLMTPGSSPDDPICIFDLDDPHMTGITVVNDQLVGVGEISSNLPYLFRSDGTELGSEFFYDLGSNANIDWIFNWLEGDNGQVFFSYQPGNPLGGGANDMNLYVTDGTPAGTYPLADFFNTFSYYPMLSNQLFYDGKLYISGYDKGGTDLGAELYSTDGTPGSFALVKDINPNGSAEPNFLVEYNGIIYFVATDESGNERLWKTDGTTSGTEAVLPDLFSGEDDFCGDFLTIYDNQLAFFGFNEDEGAELWLSDGTSAGTYAITDESEAGEIQFYPEELTAVGDNLFFTNYTSSTGRELWVYNNGSTSPSINPEPGLAACHENGTISDPTDDYILFDLTVWQVALGNTFEISVDVGAISPVSGIYGENTFFTLQPGSAGAGNVTVSITDTEDPSWNSTFVVEDPGVCSVTNTQELESKGLILSVKPNPFHDFIVFELENLLPGEHYEVRIFESSGKLLETLNFNEERKICLNLESKKCGAFIYQLTDLVSGKVLESGKLVSQ